jgi:hypothetical protein
MDTKLDKGYEVNRPLWAQVRAAIRGKQGAITLLDGSHGYYGIVAPAYRVTKDNCQQVDRRRLSYFARGRFFNATGRTHDAYVGMVGAKPVNTDDSPESMEMFLENVDGENSTINDFALEIASELLVTARYGVLVDLPNNTGKTRRDMMPAKLVGYRAEAIPHHVVSEGKLVLVDLLEFYVEKNGDEYETKEQLRRLELINGVYTSKIKRDDGWSNEIQPKLDGKTLDYIPFQFFGSENNKPTYDRPVMFDLAHENLGHFMLSCDNLENLHYHGQGMTNIFTADTNEIADTNPTGVDVGAKGINIFGKDDRVEILQIAATGAIPEEMSRVERRMIMLGAQVVQDSATNQTLGAKQIESNASTSQLKRIANNISAGLTWCVQLAAQFMSVTGDVSIKVNDQFVSDDMTAQDLQAVFQAVQGGDLPQSVLLNTARKAGYTAKTNEELMEELEESGVTGVSEREAEMQMEIDNLREQLANQGG